MRYNQSEKMEIIRTVEDSELGVKPTLRELQISPSTFYEWYQKYKEYGYDGLANRKSSPKKFWNKIPDPIKQQVVDIALEKTDKLQ
ncbi:MAG: helix-turn-helix domain-containing protein [Candidatus Hodarchaeales archaeon]